MAKSIVSKRIMLAVLSVAIVVVAWLVWQVKATSSANSDSLQQRVLTIASRLRVPSEHDTMTVATSPEAQAQHMRYQIQEDILAGDTNKEIITKMVQEYGSDALATPQSNGFGGFVWLIPILALVIGLVFLVRYLLKTGKWRFSTEPSRMTDAHAPPSHMEEGAGNRKIRQSIDTRLQDYL